MEDITNEGISEILKAIKEEYQKEQGDLFIFLFSYFYPQFKTKSESGDFDYEKEKYALFGNFEATHREDRKAQLEALGKHYDIKYRYHGRLFAYLDIYSTDIPVDCKDEELGGQHIPWYGEDSDSYHTSVWTKLALLDEEFRALVEQEEIEPYLLVKRVMAEIS